jgi:hypothetical protein
MQRRFSNLEQPTAFKASKLHKIEKYEVAKEINTLDHAVLKAAIKSVEKEKTIRELRESLLSKLDNDNDRKEILNIIEYEKAKQKNDDRNNFIKLCVGMSFIAMLITAPR